MVFALKHLLSLLIVASARHTMVMLLTPSDFSLCLTYQLAPWLHQPLFCFCCSSHGSGSAVAEPAEPEPWFCSSHGSVGSAAEPWFCCCITVDVVSVPPTNISYLYSRNILLIGFGMSEAESYG
ncbi:uncharacterized protein G2W53_044768 [Senna tora]|uniref:Secreted protein n=1 Tax=Senna tora TaxID=362788 RepID=A0A834SHA0_9FABA|nr:uncharacterized protein G2W53_044768 [Senna tora]